jgi:lysophospholipase L1-like esterase
LAYHLCSKKSSTNGRNKLFGILDSIPKNSRIILSFGEIDCRCHLIRISDIKHKPLEDIVKKCVNRYVRVIREIKNMGFDIIIWNVLPSSLEDKCEDNANIYSYYGSNKKRNDTAKMFNDTLKNNIPTGVLLLDIFDKLVDKNGNTKKEYFWDGIHLSQKAMPLVERMLK